MPVPGLSLLGLKRIRGFASILRYINPTIIIIKNLTKSALGSPLSALICLFVFANPAGWTFMKKIGKMSLVST